MSSSGSVVLDGNGITLKTSGDITLQASGTVKLSGSSIQLSSSQVTLGSGPLSQAVLLMRPATRTAPRPGPPGQRSRRRPRSGGPGRPR